MLTFEREVFICQTDHTTIGFMHLIIDFVNDLEFHYGGFESADFFPRIDSWRNILSNKLCAVSRLEPKDVADTLFIAKNFSFEWPEFIEEAKSKDLWVKPLDVSRIIKEFPANLFADYLFVTSRRPISLLNQSCIVF